MKKLKKTVVLLPTQEEYDEYMQMCEDAGWVMWNGKKPKELNFWEISEEETCIRVENNFYYSDKEYYEMTGHKIITLEELKKLNQINTMEEKSNKTYLININLYTDERREDEVYSQTIKELSEEKLKAIIKAVNDL